MNRFKVGDTVRVTESGSDTSWFEEGQEVTVTGLPEDDVDGMYETRGVCPQTRTDKTQWFYEFQLEAVE